ncbi:MAG TPA: alpha/beta fold hydrolase [Myxococcaceae bacterium]|nr:alpha/beta fold hydrolase [Myxococcaceae bacterium]
MAGPVYSFGPFRLEARERRLVRDGSAVPLPGKAFDTLLLLVEGAGSLQRQQELIDRLWPDTFVEPNNLQYNISLIRRALEGATGVELQTVRGQGYRLLADVRQSDGRAPGPGSLAATQRTHFCKAKDGTRLAYARLGDGPPIVKAANWLSHLELDWRFEVSRHWLELFSRRHSLVRYDARGNGLSDWAPPELSFDRFVSDLATVFDAAAVERAPLVGLSQGASVAVAYAARHPERVSALILIGGCARGWRAKNKPRLTRAFEAMMVLMRQGWGGRNAAFRQIFTTTFFPDASQALAEEFNELQRLTTTPDNAAELLSALGDIDIRDELSRVRVPTLVLHSRDDAVVPMKDGLELASGITGARFVPLESRNHVVLPTEPAWARFSSEIEAFLAQEALS